MKRRGYFVVALVVLIVLPIGCLKVCSTPNGTIDYYVDTRFEEFNEINQTNWWQFEKPIFNNAIAAYTLSMECETTETYEIFDENRVINQVDQDIFIEHINNYNNSCNGCVKVFTFGFE